MLKTIKPGQIVKHYANALHYGLQMEVREVKDFIAKVSFVNLYGNYEELWVNKDELELFEESDFPFAMSNS